MPGNPIAANLNSGVSRLVHLAIENKSKREAHINHGRKENKNVGEGGGRGGGVGKSKKGRGTNR
jgi:hypothetical protein